MTYHPTTEVFPSDAPSLQERTLRLRQQILLQQQYRRKLDNQSPPLQSAEQPSSSPIGRSGERLDGSYWEVERHITDLRIWEMEGKLTALLDILSD